MELDQLANVAEIIGAVGVIASMVFVGWQIKQNTKISRAHMHEQVTQTYLSFLGSAISNPEAFAAGVQSKNDFSALDSGGTTFFFGTMLGFFKHFELMFVQHQQGIMDTETWDAWSQHVLMYYHQSGVQLWWKLRRTAFIPAFREFLESSSPPQMTSFEQVLDSPAVAAETGATGPAHQENHQ